MEIKSCEYRSLREKLEKMKRGDSLTFSRNDPLLASLAELIYPLFEEESIINEEVVLYRYHPSDAFFLLTLLRHLETF